MPAKVSLKAKRKKMDPVKHKVLAEAGALPPSEAEILGDEEIEVEVLSEPPEPLDTSEIRGKPRACERCSYCEILLHFTAILLVVLMCAGLALLNYDKPTLCSFINFTQLQTPIDDEC